MEGFHVRPRTNPSRLPHQSSASGAVLARQSAAGHARKPNLPQNVFLVDASSEEEAFRLAKREVDRLLVI